MINFRMLRMSDSMLWLASGWLILIGLLAIFSCTYAAQAKVGADALMFVKRQFAAFLLGLGGLSVFAYLDYKHLKKISLPLYILMLAMLTAVLFISAEINAAQRWLDLGPFSFQPSELAKLFYLVTLAVFFTDRKKLATLGENLVLLGLAGLPFLLIFKQPDLGTALVFIAILVGLLAATSSSTRLLILLTSPLLSIACRPILFLWIIYLIAVAVSLFLSRAVVWDWLLIMGANISVGIALPFIWQMLKPYQQNRILSFLNPGLDPYGAGYHSMQSKIAIGSGGFFGRGYLHGTQTQLQFIPEQHSDFIFSAIGEEFGFIGSVLVIGLLALIVWRALALANDSRDRFGSLLATGIAVMTGFHVFANVGMALGLLPVVGMPLPFVSFGGTSLLMNMMALGILQSIAMRREKLIF